MSSQTQESKTPWSERQTDRQWTPDTAASTLQHEMYRHKNNIDKSRGHWTLPSPLEFPNYPPSHVLIKHIIHLSKNREKILKISFLLRFLFQKVPLIYHHSLNTGNMPWTKYKIIDISILNCRLVAVNKQCHHVNLTISHSLRIKWTVL